MGLVIPILVALVFACISFQFWRQMPQLISDEFGTIDSTERLYLIIMAVIIVAVSFIVIYLSHYAYGFIATFLSVAFALFFAIPIGDDICKHLLGVHFIDDGLFNTVLVSLSLCIAPAFVLTVVSLLFLYDNARTPKEMADTQKQKEIKKKVAAEAKKTEPARNSIKRTPQYKIIIEGAYKDIDNAIEELKIRQKALTYMTESISVSPRIHFYKYYSFEAHYETIEDRKLWEAAVAEDCTIYLEKKCLGTGYDFSCDGTFAHISYKNPNYRKPTVIK